MAAVFSKMRNARKSREGKKFQGRWVPRLQREKVISAKES